MELVVLGLLWNASAAQAQQYYQPYYQSYQLNRLFYYPYYYFPHNYWPAMSPQWPEPQGAPSTSPRLHGVSRVQGARLAR